MAAKMIHETGNKKGSHGNTLNVPRGFLRFVANRPVSTAAPIQWVRQSAKRRSAPDVLTSDEVRQLLAALEPRERIMVLLYVATGLRQSELFALKWKDVDFKNKQLWVTRSIVQQVVGKCKTEASQKPVPLHDHLISALRS